MLTFVVSIYLFIAVLVAVYFTAYVYSRGRTVYLKIFALLNACIGLYMFGYLMEFSSQDPVMMAFWNQVQYLAIPFYPGLWLLVSVFYHRRFKRIKIKHDILLFLIPTLTFIFRLTNQFHHLVYKDLYYEERFGLSYMASDKGFWFYVQSIYLLVLFIINLAILIHDYRKSNNGMRTGILVLIIASALPYLSLTLNIVRIKNVGLDYVGLLLPVSLGLATIAVFRYDFLNTKFLARDRVFEDNEDVLILIDHHNRIIDYNDAARKLFPRLDKKYIFYSVEGLLRDHPELRQAFSVNSPQSVIMVHKGHELLDNTQPANDSIENKEVITYASSADVTSSGDIRSSNKTSLAKSNSSGDANILEKNRQTRKLNETKNEIKNQIDHHSKTPYFIRNQSSMVNTTSLIDNRVLEQRLEDKFDHINVYNDDAVINYNFHQQQYEKVKQVAQGTKNQEKPSTEKEISGQANPSVQQTSSASTIYNYYHVKGDHTKQISYFDIYTTIMKDHADRPIGLLKTMREVTDKRMTEERLQVMATVDELSGLFNRRYFMQLSDRAWRHSLRYEEDLSVIMIDIDHFKKINDSYGHATGDQVIKAFGKLLLKRVRETDICGRLGGEEFAIVMPATSPNDALAVAESIRNLTIATTPGLYTDDTELTISIGVSGGYGQAQTFEGLLSQADRALYIAKKKGRNQSIMAR